MAQLSKTTGESIIVTDITPAKNQSKFTNPSYAYGQGFPTAEYDSTDNNRIALRTINAMDHNDLLTEVGYRHGLTQNCGRADSAIGQVC